MARPASLRRIILGLNQSGIDRRMVRAAVEFARSLELEMLGVFVEDETVLGLARLPFVRELRLPGNAWRPLEPERMAADLRAAAEQMRLLLYREGEELGVTCRFEVRRGDPVTIAAALGGATDIVVVAEPVSLADPLATAIARGRGTSTAILFLPPTSGLLRSGSVAVVTAGGAGPAVSLASSIAVTVGQKLTVLTQAREAAVRAALSAAGLSEATVELIKVEGVDVASIDRALGRTQARLLVLERGLRGLSEEAPSRLASQRNVPVLVVDGSSAHGTKPARE